MMVGVLLHLVAKSFCVMVLPLSFFASERALEMAWPT
jgi:Zn-dependent membrane protease YugP